MNDPVSLPPPISLREEIQKVQSESLYQGLVQPYQPKGGNLVRAAAGEGLTHYIREISRPHAHGKSSS